ncbi:ABC transporter ATP-binding protein [Micrococcales bacterium 31B]|nr:ABC transporter ATP-binding protein [Micrococcales bacterium 31B]
MSFHATTPVALTSAAQAKTRAALRPLAPPPTPKVLLGRILARHRRTLAWVVPVSLVMAVATAGYTYLLGWVIDSGLGPAATGQKFGLGLVALAMLALAGMLTWRAQFIASRRMVAIEEHALRREISERLFDQRRSPASQPAGEILTIATTDVARVPIVIDLFTFAIPSIFGMIFAISLIASKHWAFAVIAVTGAALSALTLKLLAPALIRRHTEQQEAVADTSALASDYVKGLRALQGIGAQIVAHERYVTSSQAAKAKSIRNAKASGLQPAVVRLASGLLTASLTGFGAYLVFGDRLTIGEFIAIIGICNYLIEPLIHMGELTVMWARSRGSAKRVSELLHYEVAEHMGGREGGPAAEPAGLGLGLRFDRADYRSLDGFSLDVEPGSFVALHVNHVAHANDMTALLTGTAEDAAAGTVWIGNADAAGLDPMLVRDVLLAEPHHVDLFEGSLREALSLGRPEGVSDAELIEALAAASGQDILDIMGEGLDSRVIERGANLSGGQRQRVALARAVAARRPVLILRDPTTAVDSVTEATIAERLPAARRGLTTLVFTSSPAMLAAADEVVLVRDGRVALRGTHHELLSDPQYVKAVSR